MARLQTFSPLTVPYSSSSPQCLSKVGTSRPFKLFTQPPLLQSHLALFKLLPFWAKWPEVWFRQVEAQFATCNLPIKAKLTKFNHVVAVLDNVRHSRGGWIHHPLPPTNNKYELLQAALINAFGRTQASKDMEFLFLAGVRDRKPSSLLCYMESPNSNPNTLCSKCKVRAWNPLL